MAGARGPLEGPGNVWVLILRHAFSHILKTHFTPFYSHLTPKADTNSRVYITLKIYFSQFEMFLFYYTICKFAFFNLHEKVLLLI